MKKKDSSIRLLLKWAGKDKYFLYLSVFCSLISGLCTMICKGSACSDANKRNIGYPCF